MTPLLFLAHRVPYPPNKGDKIRSNHILKYLAERYQVYLGAFVDDPADWEYVPEVERCCADSLLRPLCPLWKKTRSLTGLVTGAPLTLPYYWDGAMQRWVEGVVRQHQIRRVVVFSSSMAQYVDDPMYRHMRRVIDFVDVDSDKWRQYAANAKGMSRWLYQREANRLLRYERRIANDFSASTFVSRDEVDLFRRLAPEVESVWSMQNGVDTEYFSPHRAYPCPYSSGEKAIVFTGAMDYWANVDAVRWFAKEIFPEVLSVVPDARFYVVGANPRDEVYRLAAAPGVVVTGRVPDVRPYLAHAVTSVAPLRIARGIQNKVLEAMSMAKPVVATPAAVEGLDACRPHGLAVGIDPGTLASKCLEILGGQATDTANAGRECVQARYGWNQNLDILQRLVEENDAVEDMKAMMGRPQKSTPSGYPTA